MSINLGINVKTLSGGKTKKLMRNPSVRDVDILIGTIGVISKLTTVKIYKLNYVRHTVIDEAHALFDETFEDKMKCFLKRIKVRLSMITSSCTHSTINII